MQLKVFSTLIFVSLAAALAFPQAPPPDKGTPVLPLPKNILPPPSSSPPPPPPKTGLPPANTPVPHGPNTQQGKANDGDKSHLPRADVIPPPKKVLPPPPKKVLPPPAKTPVPGPVKAPKV